jgi:glycosyltransferase involved in cell wall biosynthesis
VSDFGEIDVLLPVRTPAPWLGETLYGLRQQTYANWRLVAVIHGEDEQISSQILANFPSSIIVVVDESFGLSDVLNTGLASCSSEFIARIDSDDIPLPTRFERQIEFLSLNPKIVSVGSSVTLINEDSQLLGRVMGVQSQDKLMSGLKWKNLLAHPSVMYRRTEVISAGGYDSLAKHVEDYCLWLTLGASGDLDSLTEPLTEYRVHSAQVSQTKVIGRIARKRVLQARIGYAKGRDESVLMARLRHGIWSTRQLFREFGSRTH